MIPLQVDLVFGKQLLGSRAPPGKGRRLQRSNELGGCDWSGRGWRWVWAIISGSPPPPPPQQLFLAAARVRRLCRHDGTCPADVRAHRRARGPAKLRGGASQRHVSFVHFRASLARANECTRQCWRCGGTFGFARLRDCQHAVTQQTCACLIRLLLCRNSRPLKVPPNSRYSENKDVYLLLRNICPFPGDS